RLRLRCHREIGASAGYSGKEDEVAGVKDRREMPVLDEMREFRRGDGRLHRRVAALCRILRFVACRGALRAPRGGHKPAYARCSERPNGGRAQRAPTAAVLLWGVNITPPPRRRATPRPPPRGRPL